jgi:hypothetical protein
MRACMQLIAACSIVGLCFVAFSDGSTHSNSLTHQPLAASYGKNSAKLALPHHACRADPASLRGASRESGIFPHYYVSSNLRLRGGGPKMPAKAASAAGSKGKAPPKKVSCISLAMVE